MLKSIKIENFKSIVDLELELGQFNVLIGENGCGKTNILEAIALGAAANANKLDFEFFANRGIRVADPKFMYSAFEEGKEKDTIKIVCEDEKNRIPFYYQLEYDLTSKPAQWRNKADKLETAIMLGFFKQILDKEENDSLISEDDEFQKIITKINKGETSSDEFFKTEFIKLFENSNYELNGAPKFLSKIKQTYYNSYSLSNYLIFSPEESNLRRFDSPNRVYPLGIKGDGLFAYLKEVSQKEKGVEFFQEIKENLAILDWFDDIVVPENQMSNEYSLKIKDHYINQSLNFFDQRSTNEGFLYLLFYLTLFISEDTPGFFAIDNLEASFNPKMCREVTQRLILLSKKHNKQVIVTTHNPSILDGLNIEQDNERLFVVRRNIDGHTKIKRTVIKDSLKVPLSEAWLKGYIGGLPENFN
ncbi:MAG: AAA family ATPase [Paludibacter sp.]|nr:AAA family ATPase [Paludibacter sp.]